MSRPSLLNISSKQLTLSRPFTAVGLEVSMFTLFRFVEVLS